ncbi:MAG: PIG-L deacetylase family protein [Bacteroidota bacterium]
MKLPFSKALILAPHTDDGEFGCGGTISRLLREGCEVIYVAFSDCKESVPKGFDENVLSREMRKATAVLGVKPENVLLLDYKVRYFTSERQRILEDMVRLNRKYQPDVVFTPCSQDFHQDHNTIHKESIRAFKRINIMGYELPWNNLVLPSQGIIKLQAQDVDHKIGAIAEYKSQMKRGYSSSEFIRSLASTRGMRIGVEYAEAFETIRVVL